MGVRIIPGIRLKRALLGALLVLIIAMPAAALTPEPEILKTDDWRYRALSELAANGTLDIKDSPYYLTKIPINVDFAVASVERALIKLGIKELDLSNAASIDIGIMSTNKKLTAREAWLLNDLIKEFSVKLDQRGVIGKKVVSAAQQGTSSDYSFLIPATASTESDTGSSVLSLNDVLKKINMPSAISQASLTMAQQSQITSPITASIGSLQLETINPETSKVVSLFEVLNVSASVFADDQKQENKSSAGIGLTLGNQGGGLTLDYKMTGSKDEDSNMKDLIATTGVGVKYQISSIVPLKSVDDSLTIKAGYNIESSDLKTAAMNGIELQASASLGIYYKLLLGDSAFVQAGYQVEQVRNIIASGAVSTKSWLYDDSSPLSWIFKGSLRLNSDIGVKQLAGIDLGYKFYKDASIMVGYRLIDFSDFDKIDLKENLTALGISIKF